MNWSQWSGPHANETAPRSTDLVPFAHVVAPLNGAGESGYLVIVGTVRLVGRFCSLIGSKPVARLRRYAGRPV